MKKASPLPTVSKNIFPAVARLAVRHAQQMGTLLRSLLAGNTYQPERVHQLRILSRKCAAAWSVLKLINPSTVPDKALRVLRSLRRKFSKLRDADIRLALLQEHTRKPDSELTAALLHDWHCHYQKVINQVRSKAERYFRAFKELQEQGKSAYQTATTSTWKKRHQRWLHQQSLPCQISGKSLSAESLHEFRLATKRWRYLLQTVYPAKDNSPAAKLLNDLTAIQDALGRQRDINQLLGWLIPLQQSLSHQVNASRSLHRYMETLRRWCLVELKRLEKQINKTCQQWLSQSSSARS
ncbi:MAG: CHAD domain-containing protein [Planctomycetia bacterium]|nr:CHAD domain-containing protein [Planctomycetia bacterium]